MAKVTVSPTRMRRFLGRRSWPLRNRGFGSSVGSSTNLSIGDDVCVGDDVGVGIQ